MRRDGSLFLAGLIVCSMLRALLGCGPAVSSGTEQTSAAEQATTVPLSVQFANRVMTLWPDPKTIYSSKWSYNAGIVLFGMEKVYAKTLDVRYRNYIQKWADSFVDSSGNISTYPSAFELDAIQPGLLLVFLYEQLGTTKYKLAADNLRTKFNTFPTNAEGGFWHKSIYPNQMWLDGIFMAEPFLVQYGLMTTCGSFCNDTATFQANLMATHALNQTTGLPRHGWDQSRQAAWADPVTGLSPEVWGRGTGWYAIALVDILSNIPTSHPRYAALLADFQKLAGAIRSTQDASTGLWFQVVDKGSHSDDWRETSGSGMFVYAVREGVRRGFLDSTYLTVAQNGWAGLKTKVTSDSNGPIINEAVVGMGVQTSYANYVNKARAANSWHGLCAIMLAGVEMEF